MISSRDYCTHHNALILHTFNLAGKLLIELVPAHLQHSFHGVAVSVCLGDRRALAERHKVGVMLDIGNHPVNETWGVVESLCHGKGGGFSGGEGEEVPTLVMS